MSDANAVAGTSGAIAAMVMGSSPFTFWTLAFAAMGFTGAGLSISGAIEQNRFAKDIKEEIGVRENLQNIANQSLEPYNLNLSKMVFANEVAAAANTLENTERFETALAQSEGVNVQVTTDSEKSSENNNPFTLKIPENNDDSNPFGKKLT